MKVSLAGFGQRTVIRNSSACANFHSCVCMHLQSDTKGHVNILLSYVSHSLTLCGAKCSKNVWVKFMFSSLQDSKKPDTDEAVLVSVATADASGDVQTSWDPTVTEPSKDTADSVEDQKNNNAATDAVCEAKEPSERDETSESERAVESGSDIKPEGSVLASGDVGSASGAIGSSSGDVGSSSGDVGSSSLDPSVAEFRVPDLTAAPSTSALSVSAPVFTPSTSSRESSAVRPASQSTSRENSVSNSSDVG